MRISAAAAFFNLLSALFPLLPEIVDVHLAEIAVNLVGSQFPAAVGAFWVCVRHFLSPDKIPAKNKDKSHAGNNQIGKFIPFPYLVAVKKPKRHHVEQSQP